MRHGLNPFRAALFILAAGVAGAAACGGSTERKIGDTSGVGGSSGDDTTNTFGGDDSGVTGPAVSGSGCATASAKAKRQPVYLEFVLDGSGSMASNNKWTAVVPALQSIFTQMKADADPGVGAGLIVFSDSNDPTGGDGPYPSKPDVPIAFVDGAHEQALAARLGGQPNNGTPTHAALNGGYSVLEAFKGAAPLTADGKKVIVLITDGIPSDPECMTNDIFSFFDPSQIPDFSGNACVQAAATEFKAGSPKGPIQTFVIGVGPFGSTDLTAIGAIDPFFLGNLAKVGGTGPSGCNANESKSTSDLCYFEIDPTKSASASDLQKKFETALNAIRGQVSSCTFPLKSDDLGMVDPTLVNVEVNGKTVLQDPKNGWTYDNATSPTEILLHGSSCSSATGTVTASVNIVLGCKTEIAK